jgi:hypothetical protein
MPSPSTAPRLPFGSRPRTAPRIRTLRDAVGVFVTFPTPWVLAALFAASVAARVAVGEWRWWHGLVVVAAVAVQPFSEWVLHVRVLHARPRQVLGRTYDSLVAREHRRHHADPRDLATAFIPLPVLAQLLVMVAIVSALVPTWPGRLTALTAQLALVSLYEWTHFLIHTDYKPRSAPYRLLYAKHRLHHYRNERYWFGVTNPLGDVVLKTNPGRDEVPVSATCRTILSADDEVVVAAG